MVVNFKVGKTYRYTGKIGDPSPFVALYIDEKDARLIVSGKPLVCTYSEHTGVARAVGFEDMGDGWAFNNLYHLFEEVLEEEGDLPVPCSNEEYVARQREWVKENNVKNGTKVRVTRTAEEGEDGWNNSWVSRMDENVGKIGVVNSCMEMAYGLPISFDEGLYGAHYYYPFFVLEVVEETSAPTTEVDWEKKYAELEERYNKLKDIAIKYMVNLNAESYEHKIILEMM